MSGDSSIVMPGLVPGIPVAGQVTRGHDELLVGRQLSEAGGAEISGSDLSQPLDDRTRKAIYAALLEYQFLVFPGQVLSREAQFDFTAQFGEVEAHGGGRPGKRQDAAPVTPPL